MAGESTIATPVAPLLVDGTFGLGDEPAEITPAAIELGHVLILTLSSIKPSPENVRLYLPILPEDPATQSLADSIRKRGIVEPLVITTDRYILSGQRVLTALGRDGDDAEAEHE